MVEGNQKGLIGTKGDEDIAAGGFLINSNRLIRNVFITCVLIELTLFLLDFSVDLWSSPGRPGERPFRHLFLLSREDGLGSWLGTIQTLFAGFTLLIIHLKVKKNNLASKWATTMWGFLAFFFLFWAFDDGVQIHERVSASLSMIASTPRASSSASSLVEKIVLNYPSYPIHLFIVPIFGGVGIYMLFFLWRVLEGSRAKFLPFIAVASLAMAMGIDFAEGLSNHPQWDVFGMMVNKFHIEFHVIYATEEILEMFGMTLFWTTFLIYFSKIAGVIRLDFINNNPDIS